MFQCVRSPRALQEWDVEFVGFDSSRLPNDGAKEMVFVLFLSPPERSLLARTRNSACQSLININMLDPFLVLVMLDGEGDSSDTDRLSLEPADALQLEDSICALI